MILDEKHKFSLAHGDITHDVYFDGDGPGVILMHEMPGMTPDCLKVAARIVQWGFKVYVPLFFGSPGQDAKVLGGSQVLFCIRHEFNLFHANGKSRISDWLRELARKVNTECGGHGIGVIGMCLTGNVVLSMMSEECVRVPVMCEPALPFFHKAALGIPESEIAAAQVNAKKSPILAYRFTTDWKSTPERFCTLRDTFKDNIHTCEIPTGEKTRWKIPDKSHQVLTGNYAQQDDCDHPINHVFDEILGRLSVTLKGHPDSYGSCPTP